MPDKYELPDLPEGLVQSADEYTLGELLECPTTRPWLVSAIGNAVRFANCSSTADQPDDKELVLGLYQLMNQLPVTEQRESFNLTSKIIKNRGLYGND